MPTRAGEPRRILQLVDPAECAQVRLLHRILCRRSFAEHTERRAKRHALRGFDQPAARINIPPRLRATHEIDQRIHDITRRICDSTIRSLARHSNGKV